MSFKWEKDDHWVELLRLDELGLPASWNFIVPDKFMHFASTFALSWIFGRILKSPHGSWIGYFLLMGPWELLWDGCFRYGASWKDMVANTIGFGFAYLCLCYKKVGQVESLPK